MYIDVGANVPALPAFAPGFTRTPFGKKYAGAEGKEAATRSLAEADRAFNGRISSGAAPAYTERTTSSSRLHRPGSLTVEKGAYVRVWTRDAGGLWFVVADVTQPTR